MFFVTSVEHFLSFLSNFFPNIKFAYQMKVDSNILFFDILVHCDEHITRTVSRKLTNSN